MSGFSRFETRVRVGVDGGIPSKDTSSEVELIKAVTVTGAATLVSGALPSNSALTRAPFMVMSSAFAVSAGTKISFGAPGNINKYATLTGLNAVQATALTVSATNIRSVGGDFVIAVSAVSGANPTAGGATIYIPYIITQDS
jgi:hypothetical protein